LLLGLSMHPALLRYVDTPPPRFLRNFVLGAAIGLGALIGSLAVADHVARSETPSLAYITSLAIRPDLRVWPVEQAVIVSAGPDRTFGTADDVRSDR